MQGTELVNRRTRESAVADKQDGVRQAFRPALSDQRQDWVSLERLTYLPIPSWLTYYISIEIGLDVTGNRKASCRSARGVGYLLSDGTASANTPCDL